MIVQVYPAITEPVRAAALVFMKQRCESAASVNDASWSVVRQAGAPVERYRQALRWAEAACQLQPGNGPCLMTLGVAQYRTGKYAEALAALTRAEPPNSQLYKDPANEAFLGMTHFQLGQKEHAAGLLARLRERMKMAPLANDADSRALLQEAEALIEGRVEQRTMPYAPP
jgi:tetratricopeptide (TPR) repeat protein